jgi:hypothetical protein
VVDQLSAISKAIRFGRAAGVAALLFGVVVFWYRDCLHDPPTMDQVRGIWIEGIFLAETNFDYHRLRTREQTPFQGGSAVYVTSILPTCIALALKVASPPSVLVAFHLWNIAAATAILWGVFVVSRPWLGSLGAAVLALALMTVPEFSLQIELLGMEVIMTSFAVWSAIFASRDRAATAILLGFMAVLTKFSALFLLFALLVFYLLKTWVELRRSEHRLAGRAAAAAILAGAAMFAALSISNWGGMDHLGARPVYNPL